MFYDKLKLLCDSRGTTITAVAREIGLSTACGTNWKNGKVPKSDTVQKIADLFSVSTDFLLDNNQDNGVPELFSKNALALLDVFNKLDEETQLKMIGRVEVLAIGGYGNWLDMIQMLKESGISTKDDLAKLLEK